MEKSAVSYLVAWKAVPRFDGERQHRIGSTSQRLKSSWDASERVLVEGKQLDIGRVMCRRVLLLGGGEVLAYDASPERESYITPVNHCYVVRSLA